MACISVSLREPASYPELFALAVLRPTTASLIAAPVNPSVHIYLDIWIPGPGLFSLLSFPRHPSFHLLLQALFRLGQRFEGLGIEFPLQEAFDNSPSPIMSLEYNGTTDKADDGYSSGVHDLNEFYDVR